MKKIGTKIVTVLAACAALVLASCAQPSTSGAGDKSITYTTPRAEYAVKMTKDVKRSNLGYVLQIDNTGSKDANGLSVGITNLKLKITVGAEEPVEVTVADFTITPNEWSSPSFSKTDKRVTFSSFTGDDIAKDTVVKFQILEAKVADSTLAPSIIFAIQDNAAYNMLGTESGADQDIWKPAFAAAN